MKKRKKEKARVKFPLKIGRYQLGYRMVNLYADTGSNGNFALCKNNKEATIHVGFDAANEVDAFNVLCHETFELASADKDATFRADGFMDFASDSVWIICNHNQFTEIVARAAYFIWVSYKDFRKTWRKINGRKIR